MSSICLVAALLGVGLTEALNKFAFRVSRAIQRPLVLLGVAFGAATVFAAQWALKGHPTIDLLANLPMMLCVAIVLITVAVRFRG